MEIKRRREFVFIAVVVAAILLPLIAWGQTNPAEENGTEAAVSGESAVTGDIASEEEAAAEYIGTMTCLGCHEDFKLDFLKTRHALSLGDAKAKPSEQGCEQCHGAGSKHVEMLGNESGDRGIFVFAGEKAAGQYLETCLKCHDARIDKDDWMAGYHTEADVFCTDCHSVHKREYGYQLKYETSLELCYSCHGTMKPLFEGSRSHHPLKDDSGCTICHNQHGEPDTMLLTEGLDNKCAGCHADRTGPFIYQHLSGTSDFGEGCGSCHMPHASGNLNLLKANGRALCLSCHTEMADHKGAATCWTSGCHSQIHGSNNNILFIR